MWAAAWPVVVARVVAAFVAHIASSSYAIFFGIAIIASKRRSGSAPQHVVERKDGKTGSRRALRARAGSRRGRRGRPVLQEPVLGAADSERRNCPGVRGVLSEVPEASMSAAGVTRLAIAGCTEAEIATITGHSLRDVNEKARLHHAARRRGGGGKHRLYNVDISSKNLRHHWNACSRTSVAGVSDLPSVIHSSAACAV